MDWNMMKDQTITTLRYIEQGTGTKDEEERGDLTLVVTLFSELDCLPSFLFNDAAVVF